MSLRVFLICVAIMSFGVITAEATPPMFKTDADQLVELDGHAATVNPAVPLAPAPSSLIKKDRVLSEAYYDTLSILAGDNACSHFFGGSSGAVMVFNTFMSQIRKDYLARTVGMKMSGLVTTGVNLRTKTKYRLFDKVSINAHGAFYRRRASESDPPIPRLGGYEPNTKEVRVLILLHELGHLVKGDDDNWLLPDDGKAEAQSQINTQKIEDVCGEQIKRLSKSGSK